MNLVPQDFEYWWKVVRLYGWLLSGIVTAVLVIAINEVIAYAKTRKKKRGTLLLLITEFVVNEKLIRNLDLMLMTQVKFKCDVWEKNCIDIATYLPRRLLAEVDALYFEYHIYESNILAIHQTELLAKLSRIRKAIAPLAGVLPDK